MDALTLLTDLLDGYSTTNFLIIYHTSILFIYLIHKLPKLVNILNYKVLLSKITKFFWVVTNYIPFVSKTISHKINEVEKKIYLELNEPIKDIDKYTVLPNSQNPETIINQLSILKNTNHSSIDKVSGAIYHNNQELDTFITQIFPIFHRSNPLHPDIFPGVRKMETDLVHMTKSLFHGDVHSCGTVTSGGTESIMLACKTYRDYAFGKGIKQPEMVVATSAHAAFDKASQYFNIKIVKIPVDKNTGRLDINILKSKINKKTILIVGSAPSFPHGIVDPIQEMSTIAKKYNIGLHVDCCLGGFILPFINCDFKFDFELEGVTSISADFHKYGLSPKGSSIIMYRHKILLHYQYFVQSEWSGGIYATATMAGSRCGNVIAMTWASMLFTGKDGYQRNAKKIVKTVNYIYQELSKINSIFVYGKPEICVIGIGSNILDIYLLNDKMEKLGWKLNALQFPPSIHLCVTLVHTKEEIRKKFIIDIKKCIQEIDGLPNTQKSSSIYGTSQKISNRDIVIEVSKRYLDCLYC